MNFTKKIAPALDDGMICCIELQNGIFMSYWLCVWHVRNILFPGDIRLGTMETGTGLVRAMIHIMQHTKTSKIHVINMSYGEPVHFSNSGYVSCITYFYAYFQ